MHFWSVWRALSICKDSFWIWIGLRKKVVQKCQNWEKMFLWSNRPLTWSGVVMVHFYVKTLSQLVRGGRGWSFSGYLKKSIFLVICPPGWTGVVYRQTKNSSPVETCRDQFWKKLLKKVSFNPSKKLEKIYLKISKKLEKIVLPWVLFEKNFYAFLISLTSSIDL